MLKQRREGIEKNDRKNLDFLMKIDRKLTKKANNNRKNRKNDKNVTSGDAFSARNRFLVDFWAPEGDPKVPKRGDTPWGKPLLEPIWWHFGRLGVFFSILTRFWVDSGSIFHRFLVSWGQIWGLRKEKGEKGRKGESDTARHQPTT